MADVISTDTTSKDPMSVRSRVYVGNLAKSRVSRDDIIVLFRPYGTITACTYFPDKGFGFIQFSNAHEADSSCMKLNQKPFLGNVIDVHLAMLGQRNGPNTGGSTNSIKRPAAPAIKTYKPPTAAPAADISDTMICGNCRFLTTSYEQFKNHRKNPCARREVGTDDFELKCGSCEEKYETSWQLLNHLHDFHRMALFENYED